MTAFEPFEAKMLSAGLPALAIDTFRHHYELLRSGERGMLSRRDIDPVESVPDAADLARMIPRGREALSKTVIVKLNGGLGTSMGLSRAKSLLPVREGLSFLDVTVRQAVHHRSAFGVPLPLLFMNSFRTHEDTLALLARYPAPEHPVTPDFLQHKVPKVLADGLRPAEWSADPELEWCPPGHGDIYTALVTSGRLAELLEAGFEYAFVSNGDNLGAALDLGILGHVAEEGLPFLMEVCDRTEADRKGGHLARRKAGGLTLREVAQCPPDETDSFQDVALHRFFNTNSLWLNLRSLDEALRGCGYVLDLPLIVNAKTVDPADDTSPKVLQLETAMGAAISVFEGAAAIHVPRERFLPVKTTNDLLALWSDVYRLDEEQRVVPVSSRAVGDLIIDLDPRHFRRIDQLRSRFPHGAPSLAECRRFTVRGDFRFGRECVIRGEVTLENPGEDTLVIPDGEVLG